MGNSPSPSPGSNNKLDVYKFVASEFEEHHAHLVSLWWKVSFQVFAGYVLIAGGYFSFTAKYPSLSLACLVIPFVWLFFAISFVFHLRVLLSMQRARKIVKDYRDKMLKMIGEELVIPVLPLEGWYGLVFQEILSLAAAVILTYAMCASKGVTPVP